MIELQDVSVVYGEERAALSHVSLRIAKGEFVYLVGTTGAGKSTLMKLLYREDVPVTGKVIVDGRNVASLRPHEVPYLRRRMGIVFQDYGLLPDRTVFENVAFALRVIGSGRREVRRRVPECLKMVGLVHRCDAYPRNLSGGEQQRVAIARALANDPPILLADEPTGNLDPATSMGIAQILQQVNLRGATVVVATHDRELVNSQRRRVIELENGRILRDEASGLYDSADGAPDGVADGPPADGPAWPGGAP